VSIIRGIARLARGRGDGIAEFPATVDGFLVSLTPLLGFALVGGAAAVAGQDAMAGLTWLLFSVVGLLTPAVLSHAIARRWGREEDWLRYATAYNWVQCALPLAGIPMLLAISVMASVGLPADIAAELGLFGLFGYLMWLSWVIARAGLDLSRGRAARFVLIVTLGTYAVALLPGWVSQAVSDPPVVTEQGVKS